MEVLFGDWRAERHCCVDGSCGGAVGEHPALPI
jgi:hypothetical protein